MLFYKEWVHAGLGSEADFDGYDGYPCFSECAKLFKRYAKFQPVTPRNFRGPSGTLPVDPARGLLPRDSLCRLTFQSWQHHCRDVRLCCEWCVWRWVMSWSIYSHRFSSSLSVMRMNYQLIISHHDSAHGSSSDITSRYLAVLLLEYSYDCIHLYGLYFT